MDNNQITVNRTTLTLYHAMFSLLENHPFADITVNDICQTALVSRSTFYSYFTDKYQLVIFCLKQERANLEIVQGENIKNNLLILLKELQEKKEVYQNILLAQTNRELNRMIVNHISQGIRPVLSKTINDDDELMVTMVFISSGAAGTIMWWLDHNMPFTPEDLADYLYRNMKS